MRVTMIIRMAEVVAITKIVIGISDFDSQRLFVMRMSVASVRMSMPTSSMRVTMMECKYTYNGIDIN